MRWTHRQDAGPEGIVDREAARRASRKRVHSATAMAADGGNGDRDGVGPEQTRAAKRIKRPARGDADSDSEGSDDGIVRTGTLPLAESAFAFEHHPRSEGEAGGRAGSASSSCYTTDEEREEEEEALRTRTASSDLIRAEAAQAMSKWVCQRDSTRVRPGERLLTNAHTLAPHTLTHTHTHTHPQPHTHTHHRRRRKEIPTRRSATTSTKSRPTTRCAKSWWPVWFVFVFVLVWLIGFLKKKSSCMIR